MKTIFIRFITALSLSIFILPLGLYTLSRPSQILGFMAFYYLFFALLINPVSYLLGKWNQKKLSTQLLSIRRQVGIIAGSSAIAHRVSVDAFLSSPSINPLAIQAGMFAFVCMLLLFLTSNNFSQRLLGKKWKYLHRIIYPLFLVLIAHIFFIGGWKGVYLYPAVVLIFLRFYCWLDTKLQFLGNKKSRSSNNGYRKYLCETCGFIYDEEFGDEDGGLPPGTKYEDIPDDWVCPVCGAAKKNFVLIEGKQENKNVAMKNNQEESKKVIPLTNTSMNRPTIAAKFPKLEKLIAGKTYAWCACGKSKEQPFCDGSHVGTDFSPKMFTAEKNENAALCLCKHTKNPPYCDGSHANLPEDTGTIGSEKGSSSNASNSPEPYIDYIKQLSRSPEELGHHGPMGSMGVPLIELPRWEDIQILAAQMAKKPLLENVEVETKTVIGKNAKKPLELDIPLFVSDMSFGALSEEAKISLAKGAELAGTGICSGEGGMLPEEQEANSRYFYELASAKFGFEWEKLTKVQAFHFKGGQGAKTGTGGHLPGEKNIGKISEVRGIPEGEDAISPPTFDDLVTVEDFKTFGNKVREVTGGIPIGFKLSANHIEADIQFAVDAGADYIILDGRGGGTGAAPLIFRNHISVPTIPALGRARRYLDKIGADHITLIITGGLRTPEDFIKALCLGADAIAVSNSAMQAIGCVAARMCNTNNCPAGIATQKSDLRQKLDIAKSSHQLKNFFVNSTHLMSVMARACGNDSLSKFDANDITTWKKEMHDLTGINYAGDSMR